MTDMMGGLTKFGMNYTPISSYNQVFNQGVQGANIADANNAMGSFQNILDGKMNDNTSQVSGVNPLSAGVSMNVLHGANPISQVSSVDTNGISPVANTASSITKAFGDSLASVNDKQVEAQNAVETLASGGDISVHDVMLASEKASLNMQMATQLRNKILTAYNELYQMRF